MNYGNSISTADYIIQGDDIFASLTAPWYEDFSVWDIFHNQEF